MSQGVIQNFSRYVHGITLEGKDQILPMGPAASQIAIKQLGSNGGGFFGVNSAHPFENPTPFSNFLEWIAILLVPGGHPVRLRPHGEGQEPGILAVCRKDGGLCDRTWSCSSLRSSDSTR